MKYIKQNEKQQLLSSKAFQGSNYDEKITTLLDKKCRGMELIPIS